MFGDKKIRGFKYAFQGLRIAWREERNFRFHVIFAFATVLAAWFFDLSATEWIIITFMIGLVLVAELFNTALEELCDKFQPEHDSHIAKIKDLGAAAVFTAASTSVIVGLIIFIPHLL